MDPQNDIDQAILGILTAESFRVRDEQREASKFSVVRSGLERHYTMQLSEATARMLHRDVGVCHFVIDDDLVLLRRVARLFLLRHHAEEFPDEESVGDLIDDLGGWRRMAELMAAFENNA